MSVDIAFITVNYNTLDWVKHLADFFSSLDVPFTFTFTVVDKQAFFIDSSFQIGRTDDKAPDVHAAPPR